ncbi:TetR/AcrR family transcriptional regulator [Kribbella sp. CA-293567]|uniref:TetR/AcrR family transcriptional regulator n=1 Tax=Kribbella sp. CA-293567 TaxID=3002436 RepID=UPI0022DE7ADB|nr:TetR/AcrR family transcriptional regulator [Kribbella sp. CA-293567]WBQ03918.1 TetR/AcrR family transcriptional regulator [Kribbella sp. CA-293567]
MGRVIRGLTAEQRKAERREQLLDAALELIAVHGYLATTIEQICSTAYVGTKSFYEVFDNREDCYVALLQRTSERLMADMMAVAARAEGNERQAAPGIIAAFAHALLDDPRVAVVTFGQAGGISKTVERQRRTNRRWAAGFLEQIWDRYDAPADPAPEAGDRDHRDSGRPAPAPDEADLRTRHTIAIGLVGGLFDLIADWLLDANANVPDQVEALIEDMTSFYITVRRGLTV